MDNHIYNNISNSNISRNVNIKSNYSQTNTQLLGLGANLMPTERQTSIGVFSPGAVTKSNMEIKRFSMPRILHPEGAPSTVTSETFYLLNHFPLLCTHIMCTYKIRESFRLVK